VHLTADDDKSLRQQIPHPGSLSLIYTTSDIVAGGHVGGRGQLFTLNFWLLKNWKIFFLLGNFRPKMQT